MCILSLSLILSSMSKNNVTNYSHSLPSLLELSMPVQQGHGQQSHHQGYDLQSYRLQGDDQEDPGDGSAANGLAPQVVTAQAATIDTGSLCLLGSQPSECPDDKPADTPLSLKVS